MSIFISQWLCPSRHCSIALLWDTQTKTQAEIEEGGESIYKSGSINRWCGICGGPLKVEHKKSVFKTIEEAKASPMLAQAQHDNAMARALFGDLYVEAPAEE